MPDPRQVMFGLSVKLHRERKGWTQEQLAMFLHYDDKSIISLIEKGERAPSFLKAVEIAQTFDTTVNAMCGYPAQGSITHNHSGAVSMNHGFVIFGGLEPKELRDMLDRVVAQWYAHHPPLYPPAWPEGAAESRRDTGDGNA